MLRMGMTNELNIKENILFFSLAQKLKGLVEQYEVREQVISDSWSCTSTSISLQFLKNEF